MTELPSRHRLPDLDGLRGVAVCLVLLWHFVGCLVDSSSGLGRLLFNLTIFGRTGVDLFFVLSGFLIMGILIDNKSVSASSYFGTFYARRAGRIFPAYFLLIAAYWLLYQATGPNYAFNTDSQIVPQIVYQALFAFNWLLSQAGNEVARGFQVTWSVALEEQFYLVIPLIIWLVPKRYLKVTLLSLALASIIARATVQLTRPHIGLDWNLALYTLPMFRFDSLATGGLIAIMWRDERAISMIRANISRLRQIIVALALGVPVLVFFELRDQAFHMNLWGHLYLELLYGGILLFVLVQPGYVRQLQSRFLQFFGRISYGTYLLHPVIISALFIAANRPEKFASFVDVALAVGALLASILFAYASLVMLENPIRRISQRIQYRSSDLRTRAQAARNSVVELVG